MGYLVATASETQNRAGCRCWLCGHARGGGEMTLERRNRISASPGVCSTMQPGFAVPIESGAGHSIRKHSYSTITRSPRGGGASKERRRRRMQRRASAQRPPLGRYQAYKTRDTSWTPRSHSYATARRRERRGVEDGESNTTTRRRAVKSGTIRCRLCAMYSSIFHRDSPVKRIQSSIPAPANSIRRQSPVTQPRWKNSPLHHHPAPPTSNSMSERE